MIQTPNPNRFSSSLILAALLLLIPLSSCGGGDGTSDWDSLPASQTPTQAKMDQGATSICQKAAQCSSSSMSASDMSQCKQEIAGALTILPDATRFESCVTQLRCTTLMDDTAVQSALKGCLNLDMTSIHCNSDQRTLHACTNTPVCSDMDCGEVCTYFAGATFVNCGYDSSVGHDVCWCQM
jgi:hypothetical protein